MLLQEGGQEGAQATPVLIIDDEVSVLEGLKEFLEDEGYQVYLATSGIEGLGIFHELRPEVVVTDLRMPGMPGIDLIREVRGINRNVAIIVITGYGSMEAAVDALRLDVFDFLGKPIDLEQFRQTLERARASMRRARAIQNETEGLRQQLAKIQVHLEDYRKKMSEVEPLALAGRMLAGVLHNLNSPLSYIMGQTQMLQLTHPEVENLEKIEEQALRMGRIISSILKRIKTSQVRDSVALQINDLLKEEVLFLESNPYFRHEVHKQWELAPDLPLITGIAADFSQVFGNLLRNAAEAMRAQSEKRIILRTWFDAAEVHIAIGDSGPGIPKDFQKVVFQPFFSTKVNEVGISGSVGLGLGLYSCEQILHHYHGRIELCSEPGRGAVFVVHLPRV